MGWECPSCGCSFESPILRRAHQNTGCTASATAEAPPPNDATAGRSDAGPVLTATELPLVQQPEQHATAPTNKSDDATNYIFVTMPNRAAAAELLALPPSTGPSSGVPDWERTRDLFGFTRAADRKNFFVCVRQRLVQEHGAAAVDRLRDTFERLADNHPFEGHIGSSGELNAIFYHPHIPNVPLQEQLGDAHGHYGWLVRLQANWKLIAHELKNALEAPEAYAQAGKRVWTASTYGNEGAGAEVPGTVALTALTGAVFQVPKAWRNWHLIEGGEWVMENAQLMPNTARLLGECGALSVQERAGGWQLIPGVCRKSTK